MKLEDQEEWRSIPDWEGYYLISEYGKCKSVRRSGTVGGVVKNATSKGYLRVLLSANGKRKPISIHRAVALAFVPNPKNYPNVNHKDGNKKNNHYTNLEWCDHKMNALHATRVLKVGCGETNGRAKLTQREVDFIRYMKLKFPTISAAEIAQFYNMSDVAILHIINFKNWKTDDLLENNLITPEEVNNRLSN